MLANNETGVIQPVAEAAAIVGASGGWLHVDAVQAAGKITVDLDALGADTLALSAHKLGGPQGVGALAYAAGVAVRPRLHGGGQEGGFAPGTENVAGDRRLRRGRQGGLARSVSWPAQAAWRDAAAARLQGRRGSDRRRRRARLPGTLCLAARVSLGSCR